MLETDIDERVTRHWRASIVRDVKEYAGSYRHWTSVDVDIAVSLLQAQAEVDAQHRRVGPSAYFLPRAGSAS